MKKIKNDTTTNESGEKKSFLLWWKKNGMFAMVLFAVLGLSTLFIAFSGEEEGHIATITQKGEILYEIDLSKVEEAYTFALVDGDRYNHIAVRLGEIAVEEANCPDHVCVKQDYRNSGTIICLPHQLVISFSGGEHDAIAG